MVENPNAAPHPELYAKCRECAKCDPEKYPSRSGWYAFGCDQNHNIVGTGCTGSGNRWPNFVPYVAPVPPVKVPITFAKEVKVGDHVTVTDAGTSSEAKVGDTGIVGEIIDMNRPFGIKLDKQPDGPWAWVKAVEVLPVPVLALNGCEHCTASYGLKMDAPCPVMLSRGCKADTIGMWDLTCQDPAKDCPGFVQKACTNCGEYGEHGGVSGVCLASARGNCKECLECASNQFAKDHVKKGDWWTPRAASPAGEKVCPGCNETFTPSDPSFHLCGECIDILARKRGYEGNEAPPKNGPDCPVYMECPSITRRLADLAASEKDKIKALERADKAEKELAASVAKRATLEKRVEDLEELKQAPLIETLGKERDDAKKELAALNEMLKQRPHRCSYCGTLSGSFEASQSHSKECPQNPNLKEIAELKAKVTQLEANQMPVIPPEKERFITYRIDKTPIVMLKDLYVPLKYTRVEWIREDVVRRENAEREAQLVELKKKYDASLDFANKLEARLVPLQDMLTKEPKPFVPKWARSFGCEKCQHCKKAQRLRAMLGFGDGCVDYPCKYEPRISRSERKRVSLAGQLKSANITIANQKYIIKEKNAVITGEYNAHVKELADVEQKGREAVAKVTEAADKKLKEKERDFDLAMIKIGDKLAASVPLANAKRINIARFVIETSARPWEDFTHVRLEGIMERGETLRDDCEIHVYQDAPKKKDVEKP